MVRPPFPIIFLSLAFWATEFCVSCSSCSDKEEQLKTSVDSFSQAYFGWRLLKAISYSDASSERWLRFVASQITQDDIDSLRGQVGNVSCSLGKVHVLNDSMAIVDVHVANFFRMDSLGSISRVDEVVTYEIPVAFHNGFWKVSLLEVPKPSKDN